MSQDDDFRADFLRGKVALVTGGTRGIGRAIALRLARAGPEHVAVGYCSDHDAARATVAELRALGVEASSLLADLGRVELIEELFSELRARCGLLDVFVSNAARGAFAEAGDLSPRSLTRTLDLNARAFLRGAQLAAEMMRGRGGRIVALSSLGSTRHAPGYAALGAAKAALESLARSLAIAYAPLGINVNVVCGGLVDTQSTRAHPEQERLFRETAARTPSGRVGRPEDLAGLVAFLCSPEADWIRGQTIVADGGYSLVL